MGVNQVGRSVSRVGFLTVLGPLLVLTPGEVRPQPTGIPAVDHRPLSPFADSLPTQEATSDSVQSDSTDSPAPLPETLDPPTDQQALADTIAQQELRALFARIVALRDVDVLVEAGVVVLTGTTLSFEDRATAEDLARERPGVVYVDNRITEVTSLGVRLKPAWDRIRRHLTEWVAYLPLLVVSLGIVLVSILLARLLMRWEGLLAPFGRNPFAQNLGRQLIGVAVFLTGVMLALELLNATALVGAVLGAAGVAGIALGFAFRNVLENHVAGVLLSFRHPFSLDDFVRVGSEEGQVVRLTTRETILMTQDGNHVRVPNAMVFNSVILNYTRNPKRRFRFEVAIGPSQDISSASQVGLETLRAMEGVLGEPPPTCRVEGLGDSWVTLAFLGWVNQREADFLKVHSEAIRLVKERMDAQGIEMPPPEHRLSHMGPIGTYTSAEPRGSAIPEPREPILPAPELVGDVSVDRTLDDQVEEDRRLSDEENLLADVQPGSPGED